MTIEKNVTLIIGIVGYALLFIFFGWKMLLSIAIIHWAINCERNNYIDSLLTIKNKK